MKGQGVESLCKTPSLPTSTVKYADPPLSGVCVSLTRCDREKAMLRRLRVFSLVRPQLGVSHVWVELGRWACHSPSRFYSIPHIPRISPHFPTLTAFPHISPHFPHFPAFPTVRAGVAPALRCVVACPAAHFAGAACFFVGAPALAWREGPGGWGAMGVYWW